jgi:hypothetical protein
MNEDISGSHESLVPGIDPDRFGPDGYDVYGYNMYGFRRDGIHYATGTWFDERGFDQYGFGQDGFNIYGYDRFGYSRYAWIPPLLYSWKTNVGATIGGIVLAFIISGLSMGQEYDYYVSIFLTIISTALLVFSFIYALAIYPSFFAAKPKINNITGISFLNGLLGGVIFGCIWNSNLTNKKKGISNIVYVIVLAVVFTISFALAPLEDRVAPNPVVGAWELEYAVGIDTNTLVDHIEYYSDGSGAYESHGTWIEFHWFTEKDMLIHMFDFGVVQEYTYGVSKRDSTLKYFYDGSGDVYSVYRQVEYVYSGSDPAQISIKHY